MKEQGQDEGERRQRQTDVSPGPETYRSSFHFLPEQCTATLQFHPRFQKQRHLASSYCCLHCNSLMLTKEKNKNGPGIVSTVDC